MRAIRKQYSGTARFVLEILGDKHIVQDQRLSPGKSRPTASASFLRFSPLSREPASRLSRPHRASFSSNAANRFGFTVGYDVWRIDATRYALTASDMITEVIWNARGRVPVQRGEDRVSSSSGQSRCEGEEWTGNRGAESCTYRAQFSEGGAVGVVVPLELLVEEVHVQEEVRDGVLVHHRDVAAREEVLRGCAERGMSFRYR